jgi:hypothetical protein
MVKTTQKNIKKNPPTGYLRENDPKKRKKVTKKSTNNW